MRAEKSRAAIAQIVTIRFAAGAEEEEPGVDWRTAHAESFPVEVGRTGSREKHQSFESGKPGLRPGLLFEAERRNSMIKLLVELPLIGRFTIIIVWHRKGQAVKAERDRGRLPSPATSILENAVRFKPHFVLPRTTPQAAAVPGLTGTKRNRHWLAQCTYGGLFLWRLEERVLKRSTGASTGKARFLAGPSSRSGKEDQLHDQIAS